MSEETGVNRVPGSPGGHELGSDPGAGRVQSVARALDMLEALAEIGGDVGLRQLATAVHLTPTTTHRIVSTLRARGYVRLRPESGKYSLGFKLHSLAHLSWQHDMSVVEEARDLLEIVRDRTRDGASLAVPGDNCVICADFVSSPQPVKIVNEVGRAYPMACTALGKAILAFSTEDQIKAILALGLEANTPHSITDEEGLLNELAEVRRIGYAMDRSEFSEGTCCVAVPVFGSNDKVIASMAVVAPAYRFSEADAHSQGVELRVLAGELSTRLGGLRTGSSDWETKAGRTPRGAKEVSRT